MGDVRQARPVDRTAVTATVAAAFAHDPAWLFLLGDGYQRLAAPFAGALFDLRVATGDVWVTDDVAAVAMWEPPTGAGVPTEETRLVWDDYRALAGAPVWRRLGEYERAVDAARTGPPHWYLGVLATRPDRQRQGLASAVLAPVLERADADGIDCCLETSTTTNRAFYGRRGFTQATAVHIASGPPTWWLRRTPRPR